MPLWSTWLKERPYDLIVVAFIITLLISAISRTIKEKTNKSLLWANWLMIFVLVLSLQPIYNAIDPLLGGHNIVNLAQRIATGLAGVAVTKSLAQMCMAYLQETKKPLCTHWIWNLVIIAGSVIAFIAMGANHQSSRGLDYYSHQSLTYTSYQLFTFLGLIMGIPYLVPRLTLIFKRTTTTLRKAQTALFIASYMLSPVAIIFYALTPLGNYIIPLREIIVYAVPITLTAALMLAIQKPQIYLPIKKINKP